MFVYRLSDIITYHHYGPSVEHRRTVENLKRYERPMICTEYVIRPGGTFQEIMPLLKARNIGAINWGLVAGKASTIFAWNKPLPDVEEPPLWFHDIFRRAGTPYLREEVDAIRSLTGKNDTFK